MTLTIGGLASAYQLAFCFWMCAYHTDQPALSEWQHRLYLRLATTVAVGTAWTMVGIGLWRRCDARIESDSTGG